MSAELKTSNATVYSATGQILGSEPGRVVV